MDPSNEDGLSELIGDDTASLEDIVHHARDKLGIKHLIYHSSRFGARPVDNPFVRLTYPAAWVHRYLTHNYIELDPVILEGFRRTLPFFWTELQVTDPQQLKFMADAANYDVGRSGYSIPVRDKQGRRALVSMSSNLEPDLLVTWVKKRKSLLIDLAHALHTIALREQGMTNELPSLTKREREVLYWAAQGKTAAEIGMILGLSNYTVATYLRSARYKMDSISLAQAVYKAVLEGILDDSIEN